MHAKSVFACDRNEPSARTAQFDAHDALETELLTDSEGEIGHIGRSRAELWVDRAKTFGLSSLRIFTHEAGDARHGEDAPDRRVGDRHDARRLSGLLERQQHLAKARSHPPRGGRQTAASLSASDE